MKIDPLEIARLGRGVKHRINLPITGELSLPVLVVRGAREGKRLAVSAGVHGDEYEGVRAIHEVFEELDPAAMSGDLVAVPMANPAAHWAGTRNNPVDGKNMARVFPGDAQGTQTEQIAHHFGRAIIGPADFYLDLHSGGRTYSMPTMAGYVTFDPRCRAAAEAFGAPLIWGHPDMTAGRTVSYANAHGVPWLYTEARGAGRIHPEDLAMMKRGIRNLLKHLGILPGALEKPAKPPRKLRGEGNTDVGQAATKAGFVIHDVVLLDSVKKGQRIGRLIDPQGNVLEEYRAPMDGIVGMLREWPVVAAGDPLYLFAVDDV